MWELMADIDKEKFIDDKEVKELRGQALNGSSTS